ncbi:MAG: hypothetical protein ACOCQR_02555 [bacterium]
MKMKLKISLFFWILLLSITAIHCLFLNWQAFLVVILLDVLLMINYIFLLEEGQKGYKAKTKIEKHLKSLQF